MKTKRRYESFEEKKQRAHTILNILKKIYPVDKTALSYHEPFQLLIAVILSAQCTDVRVNIVTPALFFRFKSIEEFAQANQKELEQYIHSTGFYHNKAKNIIGCCKALLEHHNGIVPQTMDELFQLPGVGRKTANVVLGEAFGKIEGLVVDTHVMRLANKFGFTKETDAVKIELELMPLLPKKEWFFFSHALIYHGRKICSARKPLCAECTINHLCPSSMI